jgi:hypothetical protein
MAARQPKSIDPEEGIEIIELTDEEWNALFDRRARKMAGMSGEEFLRRWNAGEIEDWDPELTHLVMMIPFLA